MVYILYYCVIAPQPLPIYKLNLSAELLRSANSGGDESEEGSKEGFPPTRIKIQFHLVACESGERGEKERLPASKFSFTSLHARRRSLSGEGVCHASGPGIQSN